MQIEMIGVPLDLGASRRGVDTGSSAIRIAGITQGLKRIGHHVLDAGNIHIELPELQEIQDAKLRYLPEIVKAVNKLANAVTDAMDRQRFPLVIGGDHSIAIGTVSGVARALRKQKKELGVIWIDAHGDMNTHKTTLSGNIHGMSFSALLGNGARELTNIAGDFPKIMAENCVLVGARNLDPREQTLIKESGILVFTMEDIDRHGIVKVMEQAIAKATHKGNPLHISLDIDALDPRFAPGVGTPVHGGLTYREAHTAMEIVAASAKLCSFEVVEVNPILDNKNMTAETAVELIESALGKRIL